jgi:uncharacterized protein (TIGR02147 family)
VALLFFGRTATLSVMQNYTLEPANFSDYRDFLKHRFENLKEKNKNFSLQNCAQKSKISKSLLQFLFNKKRHISLDKIPGLAKTLKLTNDEEYFVYLLVCKNASQNPAIKTHFESILARIRHEHVQTSVAEPVRADANSKSLYQDSLFMNLQTLTKLDGFDEDPNWILENLQIKNLTKEKITATLKELEDLGFLFRDENQKLKAKPAGLWRPDPYDPTGMKVYQKAAASIAELLENPGYRPSVYMAMSLGMDEENLLKAEKYMIEVHHHLSNLAKESKSKTSLVYIGNFLLTLARLKRG